MCSFVEVLGTQLRLETVCNLEIQQRGVPKFVCSNSKLTFFFKKNLDFTVIYASDWSFFLLKFCVCAAPRSKNSAFHSRSFPNNYWDKFIKRKVRRSHPCLAQKKFFSELLNALFSPSFCDIVFECHRLRHQLNVNIFSCFWYWYTNGFKPSAMIPVQHAG